jgi:hypothetical protein
VVRLPPTDARAPWEGAGLLRIDPATNAVVERIVFDRPDAHNNTAFGSYGPLQLVVGAPGVFFVSRASASPYPLSRVDPATGTVAGVGIGAKPLARSSLAAWAPQSPRPGGPTYACALVRVAADGTVKRLPGTWGSGAACRLRGLAADGRGVLWAIRGGVPFGERGVVLRIDGRTGRRLGAAIRVGRDAAGIAAAGRTVFVANHAGRSVTRIGPALSAR